MTERLTRAQRRQIESKTHQKIDLDNLAHFEVAQQKIKPIIVEAPLEDDDEEKHVEEEHVEEETEQEENEEEVAEESSEEESSDEESNDEEEEESDDDDEDLDALLNKAQEALQRQTSDMTLTQDKKAINVRLSQMDIGISVDKELYFKSENGRPKLIQQAVELLGKDDKASKHAAVVLTASRDDSVERLSRKQRQLEREKTTGSAWFDMPKAEMTPEIKRDLQILKMRHILDRKRHYKKMGNRPDPKYFQIGTIIESPTEFFSARLNKKDRKQTIVDELMANDDQKMYYKRKYNEVQERTTSGGKKHFKKLKAQRKWAK